MNFFFVSFGIHKKFILTFFVSFILHCYTSGTLIKFLHSYWIPINRKHLDGKECDKFRRSCAIVPLCICGSEIFARTYFLGSKVFHVGIRGSDKFSRGYFVSPKVFLLGILWVQNFFLWVFCGFKFFSRGHFVNPNCFSWIFCR